MNPAREANAVRDKASTAAVSEVGPLTLGVVKVTLERRAAEADSIHATAPAAAVYRDVLALLATIPDQPAPSAHLKRVDRLLGVQDVADRLGMTTRAVYDNARRWPFARKLGRRTLRFSEVGLEKWLAGVGRG